jgi:hypothetical protein
MSGERELGVLMVVLVVEVAAGCMVEPRDGSE